MLKRQGERPFKDALTLQDYGVSNGVQLDLYVFFYRTCHSLELTGLIGRSIRVISL